jgi:hypothetical protein
MNCYLHHVPGRIRVKTPALKGLPLLANQLEGKLQSLPGVLSAGVNALTGSVLVNYDEGITKAGMIVDLVGAECGVDLSTAAHTDRYMDEKLSDTGSKIGEKVGKAILGILIGQVLEGSPLALLAAVI